MSDETKPKQPWTSGTWALGEANCGGGSNVRAVVTESAEGVVVGWTARVVIAGDEVVSDAEAEANAVLMAAAPALAKALALFVRVLEAGRNPQVNPLRMALDRDRCEKDARAALELCGWKWGGR